MYRGGGGAGDVGPAHNIRPLEVHVPDCGTRHRVVDLPSFEEAIKKGAAAYEADRAAIRANFHQLATKVEHMRAALQAMGVPITQE
jgi:hypothetical protein